ncbi:hypothetical protein J5N97_022034 [Dioscorea zingiberensis]|uniref:Uncharacterized protein n=1 Tax=Dioscorea zingiberensis TaxID=325984 RepID=A0A9D5C9R1_9LILI|nr:hypothetical protein J5N97_022034 [Dioscorea zingiberensis]
MKHIITAIESDHRKEVHEINGSNSHPAKMEKVKEKRDNIFSRFFKIKSLPNSSSKKHKKVAPEGCLSVYVGAGEERFFVRTECVNHPLFKALLDDAETEFGYSSEGPLKLPCDVELFREVLREVEEEVVASSLSCTFSRSYLGYHEFLSPSKKKGL